MMIKDCYQITYIKNGLRLKNFVDNNKSLQSGGYSLKFFNAIDTITNFIDPYKKAVEEGVISEEDTHFTEKNIYMGFRGDLGCTLSHYNLYNQILQEYKGYTGNRNDIWFLILEDDVVIKNFDNNTFTNLINQIGHTPTHYIKLMSFDRLERGTICYNAILVIQIYITKLMIMVLVHRLISLSGLQNCVNNIPWSSMDITINKISDQLNPLVWNNSYFVNKGSEDYVITNDKQIFGSLSMKFQLLYI